MNHYERKDEIYMLHEKLDFELRSLLAINDFIHSDPKKEYAEYHRAHIDLVKQYALILNRKLGYRLTNISWHILHMHTTYLKNMDSLKRLGNTKGYQSRHQQPCMSETIWIHWRSSTWMSTSIHLLSIMH